MRHVKWFHQVLTVLSLAALAMASYWLAERNHNAVHAAISTSAPKAGFRAELKTEPALPRAGEPVSLSFTVKNGKGHTVRFLQFVHEKPLHLLVVSDDLSEFYHIHPEMQVDDSYSVRQTFPYGGIYRLYADYTPPGYGTIVEQFELYVEGPERPRVPLYADSQLTKTTGGLKATLSSDKELRAGEDLMLRFKLFDEKTDAPVNNLQLYLGSLAHFVIVGEDLNDFIHAHPLDAGEVFDPSQDPTLHLHDPSQLTKTLVGPSPSEVSAHVNFPRAGLYKLWAQFQRDGRIIVVAFVLKVAERAPKTKQAQAASAVPTDAIRINVTASGYEPSEISVKRGQAVKLAFYRADAQNCAGTITFPKLNISRQLPVGEAVVIEVTPTETGELSFTCGMGMYKGTLIVE
ncbi:MAG: cupredoxin domain-containing protein [Pyrinomonadaceae bacterium]|nr:cupredoxin domain-containing protein [Pyrinomonadaceae bacterium]